MALFSSKWEPPLNPGRFKLMLERQREGVAKAKKVGRYKGRKPIAPELRDVVLQLAAARETAPE